MKYLILNGDGLSQADELSPALLAEIDSGAMHVVRCSHDEFEYLSEVRSREVDAPTNSLDETRYDQAIEGVIYEEGAWKPLPRFEPEPTPGNANKNSITVIADENVRASLFGNETEEDRKDRLRKVEEKERRKESGESLDV